MSNSDLYSGKWWRALGAAFILMVLLAGAGLLVAHRSVNHLPWWWNIH
ncbi:hypothetical protein NCG89_16220 [Spongiibacter taiwanensis]|nr:hypothetical protein [Spongiibacter taiwanensis]USA43071.1 hypothetical protein NCG89_16220 [Spongiibacter taiwanensis]